MNETERYKLWLERARDDLRYGKGNFEMGFYTQVCFLTQQAIEKALKAFLIFQGILSETILFHNLPRLLQKCLEFDQSFLSIKESCQILDRYYIPTRYPPATGPTGEFSEDEAIEALDLANEIFNFIEKKISQNAD